MNSFETWGSTLLPTIELLATLAFALSGIMEAARKRMDVVGVCVVGFFWRPLTGARFAIFCWLRLMRSLGFA